ncbi:toll/interleukin-1 receptor domain-containing protein [Streptomyces sp. NPDC050548]|uniref:toll/interleukin-1 receptor domain-containing protein n=1 Tax=Streptomyces sp. NPDC050548 TaxID=3365629 RepID=UPI0037951311
MIDVFISHSSKGDRLAGAVRGRIVGGLSAMNYRVKVDTQALRKGREWCLQLMRWMADCHAAVVLLNEAALESDWVRREVNILMWRRALWPSLRVLPVLIGNVTTDQLKKAGFGDILPLEFVRLPREDGENDAEYARRLSVAVLAEFADLPAVGLETDHMRNWIEDVAALLDTSDAPDTLRATGRALGIEEQDLHLLDAHVGAGQFLAHHLLATASVTRLREAVHEIARKRRLSRDDLASLITLLTPAWIDGEAARRLLPPDGLAVKRLVALNARGADTAGQYVDRAMCRQIMYYRFHTAGGIPMGEDALDDLAAQCVEAVRRVLVAPPWQDHRNFRPRENFLHCLILDVHRVRPGLVEELVTRLHQLFPWLLIVLLSDECDPSRARLAPRFKDLVVLPDLTEDEESLGYQLTHELRGLPDRLKGLEASA